jgi:alkylation response protein AidB-like acyl-CoA dehydrogenase
MTTRALGTNLTGVHVPEEYGGQGFGFVELGIVLKEMGRALLYALYFSTTVLAATAIMNAGTKAQRQALLPPIALGETVATLAFTEPNGAWDASGVETTARPAAGAFRLGGVKRFVVQRNIIAERVLHMPKEPRSDDDRPFRDVPKNRLG